MRYTLCILLSSLALTQYYPKTAQAAESPFKKTSAFWIRGASISVLEEEQVNLLFSIVQKDGSAHTSFSGSVQTNVSGQAKLSHLGNGLYEAKLPTLKLEKPTSVQITLKGKGLSKTWKDTWYPKASGKISIKTPLTTVILSDKKQTIPVDITIEGPRADQAKLRFKASSGKVKNVKNLGKGNYRGEYIPYKKNRVPQNVLIAVSDQNNPQELYGVTVIPMYSKIKLPVDASAGSKVVLDLAGKQTPIEEVDANGKAVFDVLIPPNVKKAKLITKGPNNREDEIDLNIPLQRNLVFIPPPRNIPPDNPIKIYFFAVNDEGEPMTNKDVELSVNLGTISAPKHLKDGIYEAVYTPDFVNKRTKVSIKANDNKKTKYSFYVDAQQPQKLILKPKVSSLESSEKELSMEAILFGARNAPLTERKLHIESPSAKLKKLETRSFGKYSTEIQTVVDTDVSLIAHVHDFVSKNPATGFVIDAQNLRFAPKSPPFKIVVVSHDHFGAPVGNVPLSIAIKEGDAQVSSSQKTNKQGFAYITVTPGQKEGPVELEILSDSISSQHTLFQFSETTAPSVSCETLSGTVKDQQIAKNWRNSISFITIPREDSVDNRKKTKAKASKIELNHSPSKGRPGGELKLNIVLKDKKQNGITAAKLRAFSSLGKISSIQELSDGSYEALLSIPNSIQQDIEIEVEHIGSGVRAKKTIPVNKGEAREEKITAPIVIAKTPQKKAKEPTAVSPPIEQPKPKRVKRAKKPFKWPSFSLKFPTFSQSTEPTEKPISIDVGMVLGKYGYQQEPFVSDGVLYASRVAFNNEVLGSAPADSIGVSMRVRANSTNFAPNLSPYLLLESRLFSYNYSVALEEFAEPISDWNTQFDLHVIPRYSFRFGSHKGHVGGRVGWSMDDVMLFQQTINEDSINLSFAPQSLQGPSVGLDLSYTTPIGFSIDAYSGIGMMGGIYRREAGTTMTYPLGNIGVQLGARWIEREITLEGSKTSLGEVRDNTLFGQLGINVGF